MIPPPGDLPLRFCALQKLALPAGDIHGLKWKCRKGGLSSIREGLVAGRQLAEEQSERPSVHDDVAEDQDEDVVIAAQAEQSRAKQRAVGQVEVVARLIIKKTLGVGQSCGLRQ